MLVEAWVLHIDADRNVSFVCAVTSTARQNATIEQSIWMPRLQQRLRRLDAGSETFDSIKIAYKCTGNLAVVFFVQDSRSLESLGVATTVSQCLKDITDWLTDENIVNQRKRVSLEDLSKKVTPMVRKRLRSVVAADKAERNRIKTKKKAVRRRTRRSSWGTRSTDAPSFDKPALPKARARAKTKESRAPRRMYKARRAPVVVEEEEEMEEAKEQEITIDDVAELEADFDDDMGGEIDVDEFAAPPAILRKELPPPAAAPAPVADILSDVDALLQSNIDKVLTRGERLDALAEKSADLQTDAQQFRKGAKALKRKSWFNVAKESKSKAKPKKKKPKTKIDDVFADMENAFNGLSAMLVYFEPPRGCPRPHVLVAMLVAYLTVTTVATSIVLPCCFLLLLLRTTVVERKVEKFAERQQVLKTESVKQKSLRFISLVTRALPMLFFMAGWPFLAIYYVIPTYDHDQTVVLLCVGSHIVLVVVLQVLGTIRSMYSHNERKLQVLGHIKPIRRSSAMDEASVQATLQKPKLERMKTPAHPSHLYRFRWKNAQNIVALFTLIVETAQLATFSLSTLDSEINLDESAQSGWIGEKLVPALFVDVVQYARRDIHLVYLFFGAGVSALLLVIFILRFLHELRRFALLKRSGSQKEANHLFFFSFVGSIIYGHGEIKGVSARLSSLVAILADTFFIVVCTKLLLLLTCVQSDELGYSLIINNRVKCWQGAHRLYAALAMTAFAFYLPLATMIAPMLTETPDPDGVEEGERQHPQHTPNRKKDISYVKPFLSAITVSKCVMIVGGTFFGHDDPEVTVIMTCVVMASLFLMTTMWSLRPAASSFLLLTQSSDPARALRIRGGLGEPALPPAINVWRSLSFAAGFWGSICALLALRYPDQLAGDSKYVLLVIGLSALLLLGMIWYFRWKKTSRFEVDPDEHDALMEIGDSSQVELAELEADTPLKPTPSYLVLDSDGRWSLQ